MLAIGGVVSVLLFLVGHYLCHTGGAGASPLPTGGRTGLHPALPRPQPQEAYHIWTVSEGRRVGD